MKHCPLTYKLCLPDKETCWQYAAKKVELGAPNLKVYKCGCKYWHIKSCKPINQYDSLGNPVKFLLCSVVAEKFEKWLDKKSQSMIVSQVEVENFESFIYNPFVRAWRFEHTLYSGAPRCKKS